MSEEASPDVGGDAAAFVSPVSKYNRMREEELRAQQERLKSVRTGKRKLEGGGAAFAAAAVTTAGASVASASLLAKKKARRSSGGSRSSSESGKSISGMLNNYMKKVEAGKSTGTTTTTTTAAAEKKSYLSYASMTQALATNTPPQTQKAHFQEEKKSDAVKSPEMFSRAVDSSFHKVSTSSTSTSTSTSTSSHVASSTSASVKARRPLKHFDSLAITKNKFARQREEAEADDVGVFGGGPRLPKRSARLVTSVKDEDVVDLEHVEDVSNLETVEGSAILQAMMSTGTPRAGRKFLSSERARPVTDESERAFLQRRHLALRAKYMATSDEETDANWEYKESGGTIVIGRKKESSGTAASRKLDVDLKTVETEEDEAGLVEVEATQIEAELSSVEPPPAVDVVKVDEESEDGDKETTASKIARISVAKGWSWKVYLLWLAAGSAVLCSLVIALPSVKVLLTPSLPFCDSVDTSAAVSLYNFDYKKALQPYTGAAASASCRACPLFGNCTDGELRSCLPPYELYNSACVENPDVRQDLQQLASLIHQFVVRKAAEGMGNMSLWESLVGNRDYTQDFAAPVKILLSEIQELLAGTISYGKSLSRLPRQYVFNRALDLALRDLKDIFVSENSNQIFVGTSVAPWWLQAKHQLYSNARLIVFVVALGALLALSYWKFKVSRIERELINRLVKEVRFALLQRTAKANKWYPADYLRDDLFDLLPKIAPQDRKWLRDSVWPRVMTIVAEDSRVRSSTRTVSGDEMVVWEWISSASPTKAPTTLQSAKEALVKLAGGGRRKKASRKSFPM